MRNWTKAALLGAGLIGAIAAAGCAADYYDDGGYGHGSYYGHSDRGGHDRYYDHDRYRDDDSGTSERVRVCDSDGDTCHWEYRRR